MTRGQFLNGILILATAVVLSASIADPDLWGHVRFGQDMLAEQRIRVPDTYSFTSDRPWINHEWLSEIGMAAAFHYGGAPGLNLFRLVFIGGVVALVLYALRGVNALERRTLIVVAAVVGIFWRVFPIRPQLISVFLFTALLTILSYTDERRSWKALLFVPPLMALWVNCHGGWVVGFGVFGLWAVVTGVSGSWRSRLAVTCALVASALATLLNPYGIQMWAFLRTTVGVERPMISDWQPLYALPYAYWAPWVSGAILLCFAVARSGVGADRKYLAISVALGLAAIRVSRLDAFFAIAAAFFAARRLSDGDSTGAVSAPAAPPSVALGYAFVASSLLAASLVMSRITAIPIVPATVPDPETASFVSSQRLRGNVLVWFDWGEYVIWHFGSDLKVSIDGRRETTYSDALVDAHLRFYAGKGGGAALADVMNADYVWIPSRLPVVEELRRSHWHVLCEGASSILLARRPIPEPCSARPTESIRRFPQL